jgi:predicted porin
MQDFASFSTNFGALAVSIKHAEPANVLGLGNGAAGSAAQRDNTIAADYAAGALALSADYTMYDNKTANTVGSFDNRMTVGGTYDLGAVKLGAGVQNTKYTQGSALESLVGVSVPMGALTLGADYVSIKVSDTGAASDGTYTGYALQGLYALSKRTDVRVRYARYDSAALANVDTKNSYTQVLLRHAF